MKITVKPTKNKLFLVGFFIAISLFIGCSSAPDEALITGHTMGTSFSVKISSAVDEQSLEILEQEISQELANVNNVFSTYIASSAISKFNSSTSTQWQKMPAEFIKVLSKALDISKQTAGLYDISVGPLVNLWGFGPRFTEDNIPTLTNIAAAVENVGFSKIAIQTKTHSVSKSQASLYLDFSSIAKGYGVDQIAAVLDSSGFTNYMVEIGGELRVKGHNPNGQAWRIAVEKPDAATRSIQKVLNLSNIALATSGDYRNFFETKGVRYSHTINPVTGWPVKHDLVSVTVLADSAMEADGWATALLATGANKGYQLALQNNLSVLFISKHKGQLTERMTPSFNQYLKEPI